MQHVTSQLFQTLIILGYPGLFLAMFLEGLSVPFPGSLIVLCAGFLIWKGAMNYYLSIFLAVLGYSIGALIPYFLGLAGGKPLLKNINFSPRKLVIMRRFLKKYGSCMVCFSRPFFFGNYISYLAGLMKMKFVNFFIFTILGAAIWNFVLLFIGSFFGNNLEVAMKVLHRYSIFTLFVFLMLTLIFLFLKWLKRKRSVSYGLKGRD